MIRTCILTSLRCRDSCTHMGKASKTKEENNKKQQKQCPCVFQNRFLLTNKRFSFHFKLHVDSCVAHAQCCTCMCNCNIHREQEQETGRLYRKPTENEWHGPLEDYFPLRTEGAIHFHVMCSLKYISNKGVLTSKKLLGWRPSVLGWRPSLLVARS